MDYQLELNKLWISHVAESTEILYDHLLLTRASAQTEALFFFTISFFAPMLITARRIGEWSILLTW